MLFRSGNISQFSYFYGINPALAENPIFYILMFQGPKRHPNDLKIYEHQFYEGRRLGRKGSKRAKAWAQKGVAHAARFLGCVGPTFWSLVAPLTSIFSPRLRLDLKLTINRVPRRRSRGGGRKQRNTKTETWTCRSEGGNRRGAADVVSISPNNVSTVSMMKRE